MAKKIKKVKLAPTLIIGMGGTGCDIVSRVDKLTNEEQRKSIRYVFFDTDANELRVRKEESKYAFTVQTSREMTVGQALRNDREAKDASFPINKQLLNKPLTEGAGQVRAISKLSFDACLREGRVTALHDAISELLKLDGDCLEQTMRVVIVSTLAGGTGSGILLPVAMYLRNYLVNVCQKKPIIRGFCVLPDVFFHSSTMSEPEKNNLKTNAYAALRELDAFILKADSAQSDELNERYWLKMPRPGTIDAYDNYNVNPMDFCFLFDGQNVDGDVLQNLNAYKQHAADCIYASSISLLNKRLNSSEDNTILQRCAENGRNRYCGIGSSKMVYPFEQVREYIAMKWMEQAMTDDWLRYDKECERKILQQQASRSRGVMTPPIDKREFYSKLVSSEYAENNYFSLSIYDECHNKDTHGLSFTTPRWLTYYEKIKSYINDCIQNDQGYDDGVISDTEECFSALNISVKKKQVDRFKSNFINLVPLLKTYFKITKRHVEDVGNIIADSIFSPDNFNTELEHHIEHWLTVNNVPLHPNSVRFFLYNLETYFKKILHKLQTSNQTASNSSDNDMDIQSFVDIESYLNDFFSAKRYRSPGDSGKKSGVDIETFVDYLESKSFGKSKAVNSIRKVYRDCKEFYNNVEAYYKTYLLLIIIRKAISYIGRLCETYEFFFQQLETEINRIPRRIDKIEENFVNNAGSPIMYVCASSNCLQGLSKRCPNVVNSITLTEDFRKKIFNSLFETIRTDDRDQQRAIVDDLVSNQIIDFWRNAVIEQYGKKVDMDIIDALCTEAELEDCNFDINNKQSCYLYHIKDKYDQANKLAAPFIDKPIGREPHSIVACAIGEEVIEADDIQKAAILKQVFSGYETDELLDKYQILFMKAYYNMKISDLPKFAPVDENEVDPHERGEYYKAYWERIDGILPDSTKTKHITPHLDKRWHFIGLMPDLSEESENRCIAEVDLAFLVSIAYGFVEFNKDQYRFKNRDGEIIKDTVIVNDGRCNKLHEIYEAMQMNRPLVLSLIKRYSDLVNKESSEEGIGNKDYTQTKLYKNFRSMHLKAYDKIPNPSVFELPILCKVSTGNSSYEDSTSLRMLKNIIDTIEKYLSKFYSDAYLRNEYLEGWINEQVNLMIDNIKTYYSDIMEKPMSDTLVSSIISVLVAKIESFDICENAVEHARLIKEKAGIK